MGKNRSGADFAPALVRDAGGLDAFEKAFLYTLASNIEPHEEFSFRDHLKARAGLSERKFRAVVASLSAKGLIRIERRRTGLSTKYRLDKPALKGWAAKHSAKDEADSAVRRRKQARIASSKTNVVKKGGRIGHAGVAEMVAQVPDHAGQPEENPLEENDEKFKNLKSRIRNHQNQGVSKRPRKARPIRPVMGSRPQ